ncbi:MAG: flagellum-specific ATP synthase [Puniceicoccaceae bacterium 5H]|nr:MAG: flagellum-specific ATP synthase [Puniceicoccaceae bacterium 5H]
MNMLDRMDWLEGRVRRATTVERSGRVVEVRGLIIESEGPEAGVGDIIEIHSDQRDHKIVAEVVGFRGSRLLLMPYWQTQHIHPGCRTVAAEGQSYVPVGPSLVGRVVDGLGRPMDGLGPLDTAEKVPLHRDPPNPMLRKPIQEPFKTGVRAIDLFTPVGVGQRLGVFAGSGVGKSTLMGMIARGASADINVICLVGERGRELREFIENDLGPEGLARSVVVVSTSDQAAPLRLRAAFLATAIAEYFRDNGASVMMLMDSLTRFAMAQREIGLAVGEPPASRGYTPSVFAQLPRLLERTGQGENGSITALYTVLVEGDDMNEPVADTVRGILDGHLLLSRELATSNHYPAIDVLGSVSRLIRAVCTSQQQQQIGRARDLLSLYKKNEDMINLGAYAKGSSPKLDEAITKREGLMKVLRQQQHEHTPREQAFQLLSAVLGV